MKRTHFDDNLEQFLSLSARYLGLAHPPASSTSAALFNQPVKGPAIAFEKNSIQLTQQG